MDFEGMDKWNLPFLFVFFWEEIPRTRSFRSFGNDGKASEKSRSHEKLSVSADPLGHPNVDFQIIFFAKGYSPKRIRQLHLAFDASSLV